MSYQEYTYVAGSDEVMVDRDAQTGNVLRVYAYHDASFLVPGKPGTLKIDPCLDLIPKVKRLRWRVGRNKMFVEASDPKAAYTFLVRHLFQSGTGENQDPWEPELTNDERLRYHYHGGG